MPGIAELQTIEAEFLAKHQEYRSILSALPLAPADSLDTDLSACIVAEGTFIRYFTLWENSVEKAFIHFCQGTTTLNGKQPVCRLANCSADVVRKILTAERKFLDWSDQRYIRDRATLYFDNNGMPFYNPIIGKAHVLADAQKIRNVIAHDSLESWNSYRAVQRNNFQTERTFAMSPGQMLRSRGSGKRKNWGEYYLDEISQIFAAILRP
ncbi:hypothetical protein F183_A21210 [Bryobacterales bacterium F-183]|nr:hypothetical protein F183_A21210 [Bryobacterales bacterium F-183]